MATILNIETSTEVCSIAVSKGGSLLFKKESWEGLNHSELLTVFIEEAMADNDFTLNQLDAVGVSKGPGSYTGLRIGISVAKGLCYALDIPLIAVNSLEILGTYIALKSTENRLYCPMIDARRMEVYTALYNSTGKEIKPVSAEVVEENFLSEFLAEEKIVFFGNGAEKCKSKISSVNAVFEGPDKTSAQFMQILTEKKFVKKQFEDVAYFEPFYLKNFVATTPKNKIIK